MTVIRVPDKHLSVKLVASRYQQLIIVGEGEVRYLVIVLRKSEDSLLGVVVPKYDV